LAGGHAAHPPSVLAATFPVATTSYLAYSTATNPLATARAAQGAVKDALRDYHGKQTAKPMPTARPKLEGLTRNVLVHTSGIPAETTENDHAD